MPRAAGSSSLHPTQVATNVDLRPRETDIKWQVDDGRGDYNILDPISKCSDHSHGKHEKWKGHQYIDHASDNVVDRAAVISAECTDKGADDKRKPNCRTGNEQIEACGSDQS